MKRKLSAILSAVMLCALCVAPASALEYSIDGADDCRTLILDDVCLNAKGYERLVEQISARVSDG